MSMRMKAMMPNMAHALMLMQLVRSRHHVTKNISEGGTTLSMVFPRASARLARMSASPGSSRMARS